MKALEPESVGRCEVLRRTFCGNYLKQQYPAPEGMNSVFFQWLCIWCVVRTFRELVALWPGSRTWSKPAETIGVISETHPAAARPRTSNKWVPNVCLRRPYGQLVVDTTHWTDLNWSRPVFSYWWQDVNAHCTNRRHLQDSRRFCVGPLSYEKGDEIWIISSTRDPYLLREISSGKYILLGAVYIHGIMDGNLADNRLLQDIEQIALV